MDTKWILVTNMQYMKSAGMVRRCKLLADIEPPFKLLKPEIESAPVFYRRPAWIKADAIVRFMALILRRIHAPAPYAREHTGPSLESALAD